MTVEVVIGAVTSGAVEEVLCGALGCRVMAVAAMSGGVDVVGELRGGVECAVAVQAGVGVGSRAHGRCWWVRMGVG